MKPKALVVSLILSQRKKLKGTSGSLDLSGGNLEQSGNLALNIATGKFNISATGSYSEEREESTTETERTSMSGQQQIGRLFPEKNSPSDGERRFSRT